MSGKLITLLAVFVSTLCLVSAAHGGENFAGKYEGDNLSVEIAPDGGGYAGQIHLGQQQFPLKAHEDAGRLQGTFSSQGHDFDFTASLQGDALTLATGGKTYALKRLAANPLAGPQTARALADYTVVNTTDAGKALTTQKPNATSVQSALESTLPDLTRYFGGRPTITSAFEDSKDHRSGGASFTAQLDGHAVKGLVTCKLGDKGATVAVIYCRSDATAADWNKLTSAAPATTAPSGTAAAAQAVPLQEYKFPDGTGTVGIADGWKCNAQTCLGGVLIQGPADQKVTICTSISVFTPDSQQAQNQRQAEANARRWNMKIPPSVFLIAPFSQPEQALSDLAPQISIFSQRNRGLAMEWDHIVTVQKLKPNMEGGNAALLNYGITITNATDHTQIHCRALARVETSPGGAPGNWMYTVTEAAAPDKTFDFDRPAMLAMIGSLRTDDRVLAQRAQEHIDANNQFTQQLIKQNSENIAARQQRFDAQQESHRQLMNAYDDYNKGQAQDTITRSRSADNFDEVIRGVRTVEDTRTGEKTSVDLGNVDHVVDNLNKYDPDRYKQIPLRDEADPLPPPGQ